MALTQAELNKLTCDTPGCTAHHAFVLGGGCHPAAPVFATYSQRDGTLEIECAVCRKHVLTVLIATSKPLPVPLYEA